MKTTIRKYVLFITSAVFSQLANAQAFPGKCTMYFDKILEVNFYYENGERRARVSEDWSKCKYTERIFYKLEKENKDALFFLGFTQNVNLCPVYGMAYGIPMIVSWRNYEPVRNDKGIALLSDYSALLYEGKLHKRISKEEYDRNYASYKNAQAIIESDMSAISGNSSGYGNSQRSSSTSSRSCSSCGGTGVCKRCHGKCGDYKDTGCYTGSPSKSWINCGGCNGNGKCSICRGTGRL